MANDGGEGGREAVRKDGKGWKIGKERWGETINVEGREDWEDGRIKGREGGGGRMAIPRKERRRKKGSRKETFLGLISPLSRMVAS
jgi:hypothetical protein